MGVISAGNADGDLLRGLLGRLGKLGVEDEGLEDSFTDLVEACLQTVDVFVQTDGEHLFDGGVGQVCTQTANVAHESRHALNPGTGAEGLEGDLRLSHAVGDGAGESLVQQEVFEDLCRVLPAALGLEGMPGGAGAQESGPAQGAGLRRGWQLQGEAGAGVEKTGDLVRTLQAGADAKEVPDFPTGGGGVCDALELVGTTEHALVESGALGAVHGLAFGGLDEEAQGIERLPDLV